MGHGGVAQDLDPHGVGPAGDGHVDPQRLDHLELGPGSAQTGVGRGLAVDQHGDGPLLPAGDEAAEPQVQHRATARCDGHVEHAVTVGPAHLLPPDHVGLVETGGGGDGRPAASQPAPGAILEHLLPTGPAGAGLVGEVHHVDAATGAVAAVVAVGEVDQQVIASGDLLERVTGVDDLDGHPGEVEPQPLPQPPGVDRLVGDEGDVSVAAEHVGHPSGVGLAAATGGPEGVVDGDAPGAVHRRHCVIAAPASPSARRR